MKSSGRTLSINGLGSLREIVEDGQKFMIERKPIDWKIKIINADELGTVELNVAPPFNPQLTDNKKNRRKQFQESLKRV